ncbi:MAG: elongation factor P [Planctomycetes bacterium]|nr:elongation factor P [Planctomycetota bacterium]
MPNATEMKKGMVIQHEGDLWRCLETQHVTPGNWRGMVQATLRNLRTGSKHEMRFRSTDKIEPAFIEIAQMQYSYKDRGFFVFMNTETFEETSVEAELLGEGVQFLTEGLVVNVQLHDGKPVGLDLPASVTLTVKETTPGVRGDTVNNTRKDAVLETGLAVKIPLFIGEGEKVRVDTRTGEFMERVNE